MIVSHADECAEGAPCAEGCPAPMFGGRISTFPAFYAPKASRSEREAGCDALPARIVDESREEGAAGRASPRAGAGRAGEPRRNTHPTVKPISVMRWLSRLLCPPGGLILDPFAGSGTTGCAAVLDGFDFLGVELDPAHVAICNARITHHAARGGLT
jgi:site-specific DNA-methyltransferase (adenine-specific)